MSAARLTNNLPEPMSPLKLLPLASLLVFSFAFSGCGKSGTDIHVSPAGSDSADGTAARPFATLGKAREVARAAKKPVTVWIGAGDYYFDEPFELTAEDSGTEKAPAVWRAGEGATPRLLGARKLAASDFVAITDEATLARISPAAKGRVVALDLKAAGVKNTKPFADNFTDGGGIAWLYCGGRRMPLSRFPNGENYMRFKIVHNTGGGPQGSWNNPADNVKLPPGSPGGMFEYREEFYDKHALWAQQIERGVWLKGYWRVAWENPALRVGAMDTNAHTVTFAKPIPNGIGNKYTRPKGNGREVYWVMNLLEEIDEPGEWAMDFKDGKIYFYPPAEFSGSGALLLDSAAPVIALKEASHITLRGLTIEANLGDGIRVTGGEGNLIAGCTVHGVNKYAIVLDGGKNHTAQSNDLSRLGAGGIWLGGGDDKSTPRIAAGHRAVNNHIHHFGEIERVYAPGINCGFTGGGGGGHHTAIGMYVAHNLIHDTPHGGVLYGSMDSIFELNEVFRYCLVSNDLGAFYSYDSRDRNFGNITFRHNLMHSSKIGDGIYFDNDHPDMHVTGNIAFLKSDGKRGTGYLFKIGTMGKSGRSQAFDCTGNIALSCTTGFEFVSLLPHEGKIENNVAIACKTPLAWREVKEGKTVATADFSTGKNMVYESDPGFVDMAGLDFRLKPGAQLLKDLPGFPAIPVDRIGLQLDEYRKALPTEAELDRACAHTSLGEGLGYDILDRPK